MQYLPVGLKFWAVWCQLVFTKLNIDFTFKTLTLEILKLLMHVPENLVVSHRYFSISTNFLASCMFVAT